MGLLAQAIYANASACRWLELGGLWASCNSSVWGEMQKPACLLSENREYSGRVTLYCDLGAITVIIYLSQCKRYIRFNTNTYETT